MLTYAVTSAVTSAVRIPTPIPIPIPIPIPTPQDVQYYEIARGVTLPHDAVLSEAHKRLLGRMVQTNGERRPCAAELLCKNVFSLADDTVQRRQAGRRPWGGTVRER